MALLMLVQLQSLNPEVVKFRLHWRQVRKTSGFIHIGRIIHPNGTDQEGVMKENNTFITRGYCWRRFVLVEHKPPPTIVSNSANFNFRQNF